MNSLLVGLAVVLCWPVGFFADALVCFALGVGSRPGMLLYRSRGRKPRDAISFAAVLLPQTAISVAFVILLAWGVRSLAAHLEVAKVIEIYFWFVAFVLVMWPIHGIKAALRANVGEEVDHSLLLGILTLNWLITVAFFAIVAFLAIVLPV
jgi:hypothetical protein